MKKLLIILSLLCGHFGFSQEINKQTVQNCYSEGLEILNSLKSQDTTMLMTLYERDTLIKLINLTQNEEFRISKDIYYDYQTENFVFTIFSGQNVKNGTSWGLYRYQYITTIKFKFTEGKFVVTNTKTIFESENRKKIWWQSHMDSYNNKMFQRKEWADNYGLVPPPPPPPETKDWFKK